MLVPVITQKGRHQQLIWADWEIMTSEKRIVIGIISCMMYRVCRETANILAWVPYTSETQQTSHKRMYYFKHKKIMLERGRRRERLKAFWTNPDLVQPRRHIWCWKERERYRPYAWRQEWSNSFISSGSIGIISHLGQDKKLNCDNLAYVKNRLLKSTTMNCG